MVDKKLEILYYYLKQKKFRGSDADEYYMEETSSEVYERQSSPNNNLGISCYGVTKNICNTPTIKVEALIRSNPFIYYYT